MILQCPQCSTRYQADGSKFPAAGRSVRCAKCGHVWHQLGPQPEPDPESDIFVQEPEPAAAAPQPEQPVYREPEPEPEPDRPAPIIHREPEPESRSRIAAFAPSAAVDADDGMVDDVPATPPRRRMAGGAAVIGGWVLLVALVLVIGWAAVSFRDSIATWLPQTASVYNAAGLPVNPEGIDFADVAFQKQVEDGQQVLAVTGRIVNRSNHELSVPLVQVSLFDGERHELYHWTFVPGVSTLQPGASAKFRTRLSSPPAGTRDIELRFAKQGGE